MAGAPRSLELQYHLDLDRGIAQKPRHPYGGVCACLPAASPNTWTIDYKVRKPVDHLGWSPKLSQCCSHFRQHDQACLARPCPWASTARPGIACHEKQIPHPHRIHVVGDRSGLRRMMSFSFNPDLGDATPRTSAEG